MVVAETVDLVQLPIETTFQPARFTLSRYAAANPIVEVPLSTTTGRFGASVGVGLDVGVSDGVGVGDAVVVGVGLCVGVAEGVGVGLGDVGAGLRVG